MTPMTMSTADGVVEVALRGEIDYTNSAAVTKLLCEEVERVRPDAVRIDLTEVTFLDSSGIGVLVSGMKAAREAEAEFRVRGPNRNVYDQLRITGLAELFAVDAPPDAGPARDERDQA